jgi:hypothetical protein
VSGWLESRRSGDYIEWEDVSEGVHTDDMLGDQPLGLALVELPRIVQSQCDERNFITQLLVVILCFLSVLISYHAIKTRVRIPSGKCDTLEDFLHVSELTRTTTFRMMVVNILGIWLGLGIVFVTLRLQDESGVCVNDDFAFALFAFAFYSTIHGLHFGAVSFVLLAKTDLIEQLLILILVGKGVDPGSVTQGRRLWGRNLYRTSPNDFEAASRRVRAEVPESHEVLTAEAVVRRPLLDVLEEMGTLVSGKTDGDVIFFSDEKLMLIALKNIVEHDRSLLEQVECEIWPVNEDLNTLLDL